MSNKPIDPTNASMQFTSAQSTSAQGAIPPDRPAEPQGDAQILQRRIRTLESNLKDLNALYMQALGANEGERISISKENFNKLCRISAAAKYSLEAAEQRATWVALEVAAKHCEKIDMPQLAEYFRRPEFALSAPAQEAPSEPTISPNRKMVHQFLDLPTHVQFQIAREFGFSNFEVQADNSEAHRTWFREAKERGQLEQFRERIERSTP